VQTLATILRKRLDDAKKIAVLAIGSELWADDAVGLLIAKQIRKSLGKSRRVEIFLGHTAPENLTSQIKKFNPSHLIIIDALDMAKRPGVIAVIEINKTDSLSFSTHKLPVKLIADYLFKVIACKTIIIGIQPYSLIFSGQVSESVRNAAERLSLLLIEAIGEALAR
jgi:hydrogenase 3 maturation protease